MVKEGQVTWLPRERFFFVPLSPPVTWPLLVSIPPVPASTTMLAEPESRTVGVRLAQVTRILPESSRGCLEEDIMADLPSRQADSLILSPVAGIPVPDMECLERGAVYLDYAATTPVDPAVACAMNDFLTVDGTFGNPASATHAFGLEASKAVECAREEVALLLCSRPGEIVWTSGATEAINLALKGTALARRDRGGHIVTSPLEHRATLDSVAWLETRGFSVSCVEPDDSGNVTADNLSKVLQPDTVIVSLMHVNNETGTVTDIASLGRAVHECGALLHVDAVQGAGRLPMEDVAAVADLISVSAHKIYGPKGVGALRVRGHLMAEMVPQIHGGGHESGLRSGTIPTHQVAGMGRAAAIVRQRREIDAEHVRALDRHLRARLDQIEGAEINGDPDNRVPGILNVAFADVQAESLMMALGRVAVSSGSACTSSDVKPSHVLLALGYDSDRALSSVRFSFGRFTTAGEIDRVGRLVGEAVTTLRRLAR